MANKKKTIPFKSKPRAARPVRQDIPVQQPQIPDTFEGQIEYLEDIKKSYMESLKSSDVELLPINALVEKVFPDDTHEFALDHADPNYEMNKVQYAMFLINNNPEISHVEFRECFSQDNGGTMFTRVIPVMRDEMKAEDGSDFGIMKLSVQDIISMLVYNIDRSIEGLNNAIKEREVAEKLPELDIEDAIEQVKENLDEDASSTDNVETEAGYANESSESEVQASPEALNDPDNTVVDESSETK